MATYPWTPDRMTPVKLQSPPTPETTPPTAAALVRPTIDHYPSSAAESFKTAQEDLDSDSDGHLYTPSAQLSTDLYYMTNGKLGLPSRPSSQSAPQARSREVSSVVQAPGRPTAVSGNGAPYATAGAHRLEPRDYHFDSGMNGTAHPTAPRSLRHVHGEVQQEVRYSPVRTDRNSVSAETANAAVHTMRRESHGPRIRTNLVPLDDLRTSRRSISDSSPLSVGDSISHIRYDPRKPALRHVSKRESLRLRSDDLSTPISSVTFSASNRSSIVSTGSSPPHPLRHKSRTVTKKVAFGAATDSAPRNVTAPSSLGRSCLVHGRNKSITEDGDSGRGSAVPSVGLNSSDSSPSKSSKSSGRSGGSAAPPSYLDDSPVVGKYATEPLLPPSLRNRDHTEPFSAAVPQRQVPAPATLPVDFVESPVLPNGGGFLSNNVSTESSPESPPKISLRAARRTSWSERKPPASKLKPMFAPQSSTVKFRMPADAAPDQAKELEEETRQAPEVLIVEDQVIVDSQVVAEERVIVEDPPRGSEETVVRRTVEVNATELLPHDIAASVVPVPGDAAPVSNVQDAVRAELATKPERRSIPRAVSYAESMETCHRVNSDRSVAFDTQRLSLDRMSSNEHHLTTGSVRYHLTPGTPFSVYSDAPSSMEVSQATAVNIYPHNNESLLLVQQPARPSMASRQEPVPEPTVDSAAVKEAMRNLNSADGSQPAVIVEPSTPPNASASSIKDNSPLTNPRPAPEPPVPAMPPAFRVIPPTPYSDEDKQLGGSSTEQSAQDSVPARRSSIKQRARRYSDTLIQPFARASFPFTRRGANNAVGQRQVLPATRSGPSPPTIIIRTNTDPPKPAAESPPQTTPTSTNRTPILPALLPITARRRSATIDSTRSLQPIDPSNTLHPNWRPRPRGDSSSTSLQRRYSLDDLDPAYDSETESEPDPDARLPPGGDTSDVGEARGLGKVLERFSSLRSRRRADSLPVAAGGPILLAHGAAPVVVDVRDWADATGPSRVGVGVDARAFLLGNSLGLDRAGTNRRKPRIAVARGSAGPGVRRRSASMSSAGSGLRRSGSLAAGRGMRRSASASTVGSTGSGYRYVTEQRSGVYGVGAGQRGVEKGYRVPGFRGVRIQYVGIGGLVERWREQREEKRAEGRREVLRGRIGRPGLMEGQI